MKVIFILSLIVSFCTLVSCNKETGMEYTDSPIIEAYLLPGDYLNVTIRRQTPFSTNVVYSSDDIDHLEVWVTYNGSDYLMTPMGDGVYQTEAITVQEGDVYTVSFEFDSKNVSAYTYVPSKPANMTQSDTEMEIERVDSTTMPSMNAMPDPINIYWDNPENLYYLMIVENTESVLDPIRDFGDDGPPDNVFRKQPTQGSSEELRPMEFQYYGLHRVILYHVLPDYAALYDENSTSSQNITNPSTSIVNGYGIFTGLNSDTLYINIKEP